jgi:hypothetical protein
VFGVVALFVDDDVPTLVSFGDVGIFDTSVVFTAFS